jgi:hypothetical protein
VERHENWSHFRSPPRFGATVLRVTYLRNREGRGFESLQPHQTSFLNLKRHDNLNGFLARAVPAEGKWRPAHPGWAAAVLQTSSKLYITPCITC